MFYSSHLKPNTTIPPPVLPPSLWMSPIPPHVFFVFFLYFILTSEVFSNIICKILLEEAI